MSTIATGVSVPAGLPGAILLGGDCGALAVCRSLGRRDIPVCFLAGDNPLASYSRYATSVTWPGPLHPDALGWLLAYAARHGLEGWALLPASDDDVRFVAQNHEELARRFHLGTMPWGILRWAADKALTYRRAAELGVPCPRTHEAGHTSLDDLAFPLILKPAEKQGRNELTAAKVWVAEDQGRLQRLLPQANRLAGTAGLIVQELIPGGGDTQYSYAAVWDRGAPRLSLVARRLRQYPADRGTGTFVETVDRPEVARLAERFLASLQFSGVAEIEFKLDRRDGQFKLLDVNPRIWTWASIGRRLGFDVPFAVYSQALGLPIPGGRVPAGLTWISALRDARGALPSLLDGRLSAGDLLRSYGASPEFSIFAMDDLRPMLADLPLSFARRFAEPQKEAAPLVGERTVGRP
jgi:predicted ATP-grasp superfamily ATP-dependent carboligase